MADCHARHRSRVSAYLTTGQIILWFCINEKTITFLQSYVFSSIGTVGLELKFTQGGGLMPLRNLKHATLTIPIYASISVFLVKFHHGVGFFIWTDDEDYYDIEVEVMTNEYNTHLKYHNVSSFKHLLMYQYYM